MIYPPVVFLYHFTIMLLQFTRQNNFVAIVELRQYATATEQLSTLFYHFSNFLSQSSAVLVYLGYILLITVLPINSQNSSSKYFLTTDMTFAAFVTIALLVELASLHSLLVPPLRYCAGVHQQLYQSFHLRRHLP